MLAFLDADDVWLPHHLETCLALQREFGGVVSGHGLHWHEGRGRIMSDPAPASGPPLDDTLSWIVRHHSFGMHAVVPRTIFDEVGGFDPTMDGAEDWDFWIRVAELRVPMVRTQSQTFLYRQHNRSLSQQSDRVSAAGLRALARLERDHRPASRSLRAAIRDARAWYAFDRASAHVDAGEYRSARHSAIRALRGPASCAARASVIALAPALYAGVRSRRRAQGPRAGQGAEAT
jgi:hypothetical protein